MTERSRKPWEILTPEQRAAVERFQAKHRSPEYRAEEEKICEEARQEFPRSRPTRLSRRLSPT
jgi:hypothetical protein